MSTGTNARASGPGRAVEATLEIAAPVEAVWKALTDAEELKRWFPIDASVTPGEGGRIRLWWSENVVWQSRIAIWEPGRRLRAVMFETEPPAGGSREGHVAAASEAEAGKGSGPVAEIAVDYFLESAGGRTTLRIVHSGFGAGAAWDDEYAGTARGWFSEMRCLRHYLERHRGTPRRVAWHSRRYAGGPEIAWDRLIGPGRLVEATAAAGAPKEGDAWRLDAAVGAGLGGRVEAWFPPHEFQGTIDGLNGAVMRIMTADCGLPGSASFWLATYGVAESDAAAIEKALRDRLTRLIG